MSMKDGDNFLSGEVKTFLKNLSKRIRNREVYEIEKLYVEDFHNLTERYFKASAWPNVETVAKEVDDPTFLIFYKELYFRHIYAKMGPTVDDRLDSFETYVKMFDEVFLKLDPVDPEVEIPAVWMWDIIDEFITQFRLFHNFRTNSPSMNCSGEEIDLLKKHDNYWESTAVLTYLYTLSKKAGIPQTSKSVAPDQPPSPFFKMVGEFAQIGLSRVHVLLSDYTSSLQALDKINFLNRTYYQDVLGCHASLNYYMGVSYLMLKRYSDATACFSSFLGPFGRNNHKMVVNKQQLEDVINNMYGSLTMSLSLKPETVEESLQMTLDEKFGDRIHKMREGDLMAFEETFYENCPQYVTPRAPDYDKGIPTHQEAPQLQLKVFCTEIRQRSKIPEIQTHLKMYTAVGVSKLAQHLKKDQDALSADLLMIRHKTKQLRQTKQGAPPSSGEWSTQPAKAPFYISKEVVHVAESKDVDRYGQAFVNNLSKYEDLIFDVRRI